MINSLIPGGGYCDKASSKSLPPPHSWIMSRATKTFSPPWSPQTWDGKPYWWMALWKEDITVLDRLLVEHFRRVIILENPLMPLWITKPHLMRLWPVSIYMPKGIRPGYAVNSTCYDCCSSKRSVCRIYSVNGSTHSIPLHGVSCRTIDLICPIM